MIQFGLKTRLLLLTIIPTLTISVLLSLYFIQSRTSELDDGLEHKGFAIIDQYTPMVFNTLSSVQEQSKRLEAPDTDSTETPLSPLHSTLKRPLNNEKLKTQLQTISNRIIEESDVRAATIYGMNGSQLAHAGPTMKSVGHDNRGLANHATHYNHSQLNSRLENRIPAPNTNGTINANTNHGYSSGKSNRNSSAVQHHAKTLSYHRTLHFGEETIRFTAAVSDTIPTLTQSNTHTPIGWIEIELSRVNVKLQKYQLYLTITLVIAFGFAINSFFGIRLSRNITEPLNEIISAVNRVKDGHLDTRVHTYASGELHHLELGINSMVESLKIANEELKQSVDQATEDLRETLETIEIQNIELDLARKEALEASRIKSEFLANMSHEIRTPLNGIIGFTKLLLKTDVTSRQQDYLSTIHKSSDSLLAIINDILDFSKIEAGKLVLDYIPISLRDVIEEVITMVAPLAHDKQLEVVSLVYNDVPSNLIGDPLRLKQIITNLVNNAIKFTEQGNIILRTMLESREEKFAICKISVTDTGIGLSEEDQGVIFKAFNQADTSAARRFGGTGLGLVISKHLVEQMGGEIGLQSEPGKGSTFWFKVRLDINTNVIESTQTSSLKGKRIAVFDTNPIARLSLCHLLESWNIKIGEVEILEEVRALIEHAKLAETPYDAMIIGLTPNRPIDQHLTQLLDDLLHHFECPTILLTNTSDPLPQQHSIDDIVYAWINKPLRSKQLFDVLTQLFSHTSPALGAPLGLSTTPLLDLAKPATTEIPSILCVDDNEANLKLICVLLEELGINVTGCESGMQALEHLENRSFDLIFMDIQMPVMDGVETTRRIRENESKQEMQTTIVALTAHALASEKQELLNAGMNDYVTKPINETLLIETIYKWTGFNPQLKSDQLPANLLKPNSRQSSPLPNPLQPNPHKASSSQQQSNNTTSLNKPIIDLEEGIALANGKIDLADEMLLMLLATLQQEREAFTEAWESEDFDLLLERVHKMHGATRYCGVPALRKAAGDMETLIKKVLKSEIKQVDLIPAFKELIVQIQNIESWEKSLPKQQGSIHDNTTLSTV